MVALDEAYYARLTKNLRDCSPDQLSGVVQSHKAVMLAAKFREPSEKVFAENLPWVAEQIIMQPDGRHFKDAEDITDADLKKLEVLRAEHDFDYMKDLRINFSSTVRGRSLDYKEPLLIYLAARKGDFTDYQASVIEKLVEGLERQSLLDIWYVTRAGRDSVNHNEGKNLFHVLMEDELTPNKKKIADLVAPELATASYRVYATTESWKGSYGQDIYQYWDAWRNALHSAVSSGRIENVEYALSKGAKQSASYNGFGSTAFSDAVGRSDQPAYRAIAQLLFENALTLPKGAEILRERSRWKETGNRPIETLANKGDIPFVVAMARANAGDPETAVQTFTDTAPVTLGGYHSVAGQDAVYHAPIQTTRTKTECVVYETGNIEDPFPYIRAAVFNLNPATGYYSTYKDIFNQAVKYCVEKEALNADELPGNDLADPRSLNFIFSMRAAAMAEKTRNPGFLEKTATFTESFAEEVRKARMLTNNFRVVYDPDRPDETCAKAYDDEALSPGRAIAVKGPLQLKKPASGVGA